MEDLDRLCDMLSEVDPGMLTMPQTPEQMVERIERSQRAFARPSSPPDAETYFLVLEEAGEILGTASLITNLGRDRPFYSFRITRDSKVSPELGVKVELDILHLVNDYHGDTEMGTLFLRRSARGGGRGKLLSYARLMLIAADPVRFGARVMAEVRGWTDASGKSPFWDAVGAKFFRVDYRRADTLSAREHRFIADLMPRYPIYADLLPEQARSVIGKPHPDAEPALALLKAQGFRFNNVVDIFDAGPCVDAYVEDIHLVRDSLVMSADEFRRTPYVRPVLVGATGFSRFAVAMANSAEARPGTLERLDLDETDPVRVFAP